MHELAQQIKLKFEQLEESYNKISDEIRTTESFLKKNAYSILANAKVGLNSEEDDDFWLCWNGSRIWFKDNTTYKPAIELRIEKRILASKYLDKLLEEVSKEISLKLGDK